MSDNTVCGYKNYATFSVALQWDNERYLYQIQRDILRQVISAASEGYNPIDNLARIVQRNTHNMFYRYFYDNEDQEFKFNDLYTVDWHEIAESMLADWILNKGDMAAIGLSE